MEISTQDRQDHLRHDFGAQALARVQSYKTARLGLLICILSSCTVFLTYAYGHYKPFTFALYDSGWHVQQVRSLVDDGDLDLRNQLENKLTLASGMVALGADGQWFPIHEPVLAILAVPFYMLFGINGCLALNVLLCVVLVALVYQICLTQTSPAAALSASTLAAFTSVLLPYSYDFSIDVLGAVLLAAAFLSALREQPTLCGMLWGIAIFSRMINVVTLPGFLLLIFTTRHRTPLSSFFSFIVGGAPFLLLLFISNYMMFGDPLTFRYSRWAHLSRGTLQIVSQWQEVKSSFDQGLYDLILHREKGILISQPLLLPALLFGLPQMIVGRARGTVALIVIWLAMLAFFSVYAGAMNTSDGNRYFIFPIVMCALPLCYLFRLVESGSKKAN